MSDRPARDTLPSHRAGRAAEGEFDLIAWIKTRAASTIPTPATVLGVGDDCAILRLDAARELLITTDMLLDGRHFVLSRDGPEAVGWKSLAVNLSDIAAMAGRPVAAVVAVALPKQGSFALAQRIVDGMIPLARRFGVALVGGDTNAWDGSLAVAVTILGEATMRGAVRRSGARPGDAVVVTGPLGGSILGRHLRPEPRVFEAIEIQERVDIHAMIDISDGFVADLGHILESSRAGVEPPIAGSLGADLDAGRVPIHDDARLLATQTGRPALEHALHDGEDFELCLALAPADLEALRATDLAPRLFHVGNVTREPGIRLRRDDGSITTIEPRGFDHFQV